MLAAASATAHAEPNLVVRSDGDCPSGQAVAEALWAIRPDSEWPPLLATIHVTEIGVQVALGEDPANRREIAAPADCADRVNRVAVVIAVWSGELPAHATGAPSLTIAAPAPVLAPVARPAMVTEVGLSGFYSVVGGYAPGVQVELARLRRQSWWGARAVAAYQSTRSVRVDIGDSRYERAQLGAFLVLRWTGARLFLSGDAGALGAFTRAHGEGYSQNQSAYAGNAAVAVDGRAGLRLGTFRVWADLQACRWASQQTLRIDPVITGPSTTSTLPAWDAHLGLGASVAFD
jgi:hypothetical protein